MTFRDTTKTANPLPIANGPTLEDRFTQEHEFVLENELTVGDRLTVEHEILDSFA